MKYCDLTQAEVEKALQMCNFTKEERATFEELSHGCTIEQTAEILNYSVSTIKRLKNKINAKMSRI